MAYAFRHGDRPLDGITVQRAVGRGGFGEVYYAITDAGKEIALKFLRDNPEVELRGVQHVMNLTSPHLVKIYDVRWSPVQEPFVLMEYINGPSLRDVLIAEPGGLAPEKAVFFANGIAHGLAHLHSRGVVHRDLKPGNIFYDDGYVKIGDYGLSKQMSVSQHSAQTISVGTVHYMAPEIGSGRYTKLVDIYALGVILYEMLCGRLPFTGASIQEVLIRQMRDLPDTSRLPAGFAPIVARALAKDPAERFQSADQVADALARLVEIGQPLSPFDPASLTHVPRGVPATADAITHTAPILAGPPLMDVRAALVDVQGRRPYEVPPPYGERYVPRLPEALVVPLGMTVFLDACGIFFAVAGALVGGGPFVALRQLMFVSACIPFSILLYRWWGTLPPGWRRTTPARAVGFSFIPLFNLYWFYIAFHGLVIDLNHYCATFARDLPRLAHGWLVGYWLFFLAAAIAYNDRRPSVTFALFATCAGVLAIVFMVKTTRACQALLRRQTVNALPNSPAAAAV